MRVSTLPKNGKDSGYPQLRPHFHLWRNYVAKGPPSLWGGGPGAASVRGRGAMRLSAAGGRYEGMRAKTAKVPSSCTRQNPSPASESSSAG